MELTRKFLYNVQRQIVYNKYTFVLMSVVQIVFKKYIYIMLPIW